MDIGEKVKTISREILVKNDFKELSSDKNYMYRKDNGNYILFRKDSKGNYEPANDAARNNIPKLT